MNPTITILGSCRQTPISKYFPVTGIRDNLNYPHYTKEILQEIQYLKYNNIEKDMTKYCFRDGLLSNCSKEISTENYNNLKKDFDRTDIFLVEIASRISYKWNNLYLHHIATEEQYKFPFRNDIEINDLSDEDIENDLLEIRKELYPKKFIVLSHFATYQRGKRFELIQLLSNICKKLDIPFIDQSIIFQGKEIFDVVQKEPILAHFTQTGEEIIAKVIYDKINEISDLKDKYQIYYTDEDRVKKYTFHGFGDHIRGCIFMYQFCKNNHFNLKINFSHHYLNDLFYCKNFVSLEDTKNAYYYFNHDNPNGIELFNNKHIFTNLFPIQNINEDCKKFLIDNCFTPRLHFEKKINNIKDTLSVKDYEYNIIHLRLFDNEQFNNDRFNRINHIINNICESNKKYILIGSNDIYLSKIEKNEIIKTNLERCHVGLNNTTYQQIEDTMLEFMLMTTCNKIYQLSVYDWGSGFSDTINKIYNIEVIKYKI
jgi:hypothetical protein